MDNKKSAKGRVKRAAKVLEENFWDCSLCTYKNSPEAFKCLMCDVRKGTSTRKPRINPQLAQQFLPAPAAVNKIKPPGTKVKGEGKKRRKNSKDDLCEYDPTTEKTEEITVNNVTITIKEYLPKAVPGTSNVAVSESSSQEDSLDGREHEENHVNGRT